MLTRTKKLAYLATRMTWSYIMPRRVAGMGNQGGSFGFSETKWNREELNKKLQKEISDLEGSIQKSDPESEAYFKKYAWNTRYIPEKVLFQFSKIDGGYDVRVLTHVEHTPPNSTTNGEPLPQQQAEDPNKRLNYSQTKIFIKKQGADKWLAAEMAIFDGSVELLTLSFTQEEPSFNWVKTEYSGPQISSLPQEVANGLNMLFKQFGITPEILMNMAIHSSNKVQELNIAWLENLKEICT